MRANEKLIEAMAGARNCPPHPGQRREVGIAKGLMTDVLTANFIARSFQTELHESKTTVYMPTQDVGQPNAAGRNHAVGLCLAKAPARRGCATHGVAYFYS